MSSFKKPQLNYSAIPEDSEENIQDSDPNHNHQFESLYPSSPRNMNSKSPSLRAMETRRNNLKHRIAQANNALHKKKHIESGNLAGMSLLEVNDDTSDDGFDENSMSSKANMFRKRRQSKESAYSGIKSRASRQNSKNKIYDIGNIEDKYIEDEDLVLPILNENQPLQQSSRYKNKLNIVEPTCENSNRSSSKNDLTTVRNTGSHLQSRNIESRRSLGNSKKKSQIPRVGQNKSQTRKNSHKVFSTEIKM